MIPSTIAFMSTGSRGQQQLATAAQQLPLLDRYGYRHDASLSHPRVMVIRMEEPPDDIAFSSGRQDDISTSSPFTPLLYIWTNVWVLPTPNAGRNDHFQRFYSFFLKTLFLGKNVFLEEKAYFFGSKTVDQHSGSN